MTTVVSTGHGTRYIGAVECADRYGFSSRHWVRLVDSGRAPQPVRFGRLRRWSVDGLEQWEKDGCPRLERRAGR